MTSPLDMDRRGLIGGTLGALTLAAASGAAAAPAASHETIKKSRPPRGSFGIVQPGIKRTAFLNAPAGMTQAAFKEHWLATYADALKVRGARAIVFNLIDKEHSPEKRFEAILELVFDSDLAYEREYLSGRSAYTEEAEHTNPALVVVTHQIGIRDFDPALPMPAVKRFGLVRRKPELTTDTLAVAWRDEHAPLFGANNYLRRYYVNLTDRIYAPDVPWDGYADIWWDDFAHVGKRADARVPEPESDAVEVLYMFMTPTTVL